MARNGASLTVEEKRIVKALLNQGRKNQDVHALINLGRSATVNFGRIADVKKNGAQDAATEEEIASFRERKESYDPKTGLNAYSDERLVRAREAMILAVQSFNSPALKFKAEVYCVLANIAWTYLLHEHLERQGVKIVGEGGFSLPLSAMIVRDDCPLSDGIKNNLRAMKTLRDKVEHHLLGQGESKWFGIFQACCLNFDKTICELFGARLTLAADLSFALQFAKINLEQAATLNKYQVPPSIAAIDALVSEGMTPEQMKDVEFQFQVVYTFTAAPKSKAHIQFVSPASAEGKQIHNVLAKKVVSDDEYPYKPAKVVALVSDAAGVKFTMTDHSRAFKWLRVRPGKGAAQPQNTDKAYCIYHSAHGDYTYSSAWVNKLVSIAQDEAELQKLRAIKA